jgi:chromosome segregation ATPase
VTVDTNRMKTLAAAAAAFLVLAPAAQADVSSSISNLANAGASFHSTVVADAQKLAADAQSLQGTTDKAAGKALLQGDLAKLKADLQAWHQTLDSARGQLKSDLQAFKSTKPSKDQIQATKQSLEQLHASLKSERVDVQSANQAAKTALEALRLSFKK